MDVFGLTRPEKDTGLRIGVLYNPGGLDNIIITEATQ